MEVIIFRKIYIFQSLRQFRLVQLRIVNSNKTIQNLSDNENIGMDERSDPLIE